MKFKRQTQMRISASGVDNFEEDGFSRPVRKVAAHIEDGYDNWRRPSAAVFRSDPEGISLTVERDGVVLRPVGEDALEAAACYVDAPQAVPAFRPGEGGAQQK